MDYDCETNVSENYKLGCYSRRSEHVECHVRTRCWVRGKRTRRTRRRVIFGSHSTFVRDVLVNRRSGVRVGYKFDDDGERSERGEEFDFIG